MASKEASLHALRKKSGRIEKAPRIPLDFIFIPFQT
jgi:hypothetical protein